MQHIGIVGAGNVGSSLARIAGSSGYPVRVAASTPSSPRLAALAADGILTGDPASVVDGADVVVLALPFAAVAALVDAMGADRFAGKVVIDATNPLTDDFMGLTVGHTTSGGETVAGMMPRAKVVKAFNTIMAATLDRPRLGGAVQVLPVASDHEDAKRFVLELGRALGFDAVDSGPLSNARYLEPAVELVIQWAYAQQMGPNIGLALVRG